MAEAACYSKTGEPLGRTVELPASVFGVPVNEAAIHSALLSYAVNQSLGTSNTRNRGEVRGGGRKPYRQKGTGHARQGSRVAPHYRGGGIVHGPNGHRTRRRLTKRARQAAICSALSARAAAEKVKVVEPLELEEPKTRVMAEALGRMELAGTRVCVIVAEPRHAAYRSLRNIPGVEVRVAPAVCTYDVMVAGALVVEEAALPVLERAFGTPPDRGRKAAEGADA